MARMKALSECRVNAEASGVFFQRVLTYPMANAMDRPIATVNDSAIKAVQELHAGRGKGACCHR